MTWPMATSETVETTFGLSLTHRTPRGKPHPAVIVRVVRGDYDISHVIRCKCGDVMALHGVDG